MSEDSQDKAMGIPLAIASDEAIEKEMLRRKEAKMREKPPRKKDAVDLGWPASREKEIKELDASTKD